MATQTAVGTDSCALTDDGAQQESNQDQGVPRQSSVRARPTTAKSCKTLQAGVTESARSYAVVDCTANLAEDEFLNDSGFVHSGST